MDFEALYRYFLPTVSKQTLKIMKLTVIILFATCIQVSARGYSQITLSETNSPLQSVFQKIQQQSGFDFVSSYEILRDAGNVTVNVRNVSLQKALDECLKGKSLTYVIIGTTVVVRPEAKTVYKMSTAMSAMASPPPPFVIHGRVVNEQGEPFQNASVLIAGTTTGTTTDNDGRFTLTVTDDKNITLEISGIGYKTKMVNVGKQSEINVVLELDIAGLGDVVVVGYGTQRKKDITGSVAVVNMDALKSVPSTTVEQQLQGQAAGVNIISSGAPGGESNIFIRGITSFGNNDPLVIVDGVQGSLHDLNPNDIASIQVLKDAGAAAIYGVRGSNGVILVTTKKGKSGAPTVTYDANFGDMVPPKGNVLNLASPADLAAFIYKVQPATQLFPGGVLPDFIYAGSGGVRGIGNAGDPAVDPAKYVFDPGNPNNDYLIQKVSKGPLGTDWFHQIFKPAFTQRQTISVTGGSNSADYLFSVGYLDQQGSLIETGLKRYSVRVNTNFKIGKKIRVGENAYLFYKRNPLINNQDDVNAIKWAYQESPIIPVYDIMGNYGGTWAGPELGPYYNPVAQMRNTANNKNNTWQTFGNVYAEVDFLKHFTARTSFGGTIENGYFLTFLPNRYHDLEQHSNPNSLSESANYNSNWIWTNTITYNQVFGKHNVKALAGSESFHDYSRSLGGSSSNFFSSDPNYLVLSNGTSDITNFSKAGIDNLYSVFGRVDYSFEDKYLLAATIRRDGSSRFSDEKKYGIFPSVSLGWRMSGETFMKNIRWLDDLKLRGSWGKLGSQNNVPTTNAFNLYNSDFGYSYYDITGSGSTRQGFYQSAIGNQSTGWEEDIISNIGLDATILNNSINISADWYKKSTNGLLFPQPLPATTGGAASPIINIGDIQNTGLDLAITYHGGRNSDFKYNIGANITTYKNLVVKIPDPGYFDVGLVRNEVGHQVSSFFGYEVVGFFRDAEDVEKSPTQQDAAPGRFKYKDTDGDGQITPDDRTFFGNPNPDFTYGINFSASYRNFDFSMVLYGSQGNQVYNTPREELTRLGTPGAYSKDLVFDSWTPQNLNPKAPVAEALSSSFSDGRGSSFYVENGSFLKSRSLMLGYSLDPSVLKRSGISRFRIYIQAANLFTLTKYSGLDPELLGTSESFGIDVANYPNNFKNYILGVNVSF